VHGEAKDAGDRGPGGPGGPGADHEDENQAARQSLVGGQADARGGHGTDHDLALPADVEQACPGGNGDGEPGE
jgi:hypothetical protein